MPLERSRPLHEQIHDRLQADIRDGVLRDGQRVLSAREIATSTSGEWLTDDGRNVSTATADRALKWLESDGLVTRDPHGTFVRAGRLRPGPLARLAMTDLPPAERIEVRSAAYEQWAPRYVWPLLGLEPVRMTGECHVIRREQVHYGAGDIPFMLSADWIHPRFADAAPELTRPEPLASPARLIAERVRIPVTRGRDAYEARAPRPDGREIPLLRLPELAPGIRERVLAVVWTWFSAADAVVYTESVLPVNTVLETEYEVSI